MNNFVPMFEVKQKKKKKSDTKAGEVTSLEDYELPKKIKDHLKY